MSDGPPTVGAIASWFGSKRTMSKLIARELGPHAAYWDFFAGGMAVLLAKRPSPMETVNDLHGDLTNLARVIKSDTLGPILYRRLRRTLLCQEFVADATRACRARMDRCAPPEPDVQAAYEFFIYSWLAANGITGTAGASRGGFNMRYTSNGGSTNKRWTAVVDSIPAWRRRLRNVVVCNVNARHLFARVEDKRGTVIYLDPPYVEKGAEYVHDFAGVTADGALFGADADAPMTHGELAEMAKRFKATRVVISYYDHPALRRLYDGWTFKTCTQTKSLVSQGNRGKKGSVDAPEVLIINGPSLTDGSTQEENDDGEGQQAQSETGPGSA